MESGARLELEVVEERKGEVTYLLLEPVAPEQDAVADLMTYTALLEFLGSRRLEHLFHSFLPVACSNEIGIALIILDYMYPLEIPEKHGGYIGSTDTSSEETISYLRFIVRESSLGTLNYLLWSADYLDTPLLADLIESAIEREHYPIACRLLQFAEDREEQENQEIEQYIPLAAQRQTLKKLQEENLMLRRNAILATCKNNNLLHFKMFLHRYKKRLIEIDPDNQLQLQIQSHCVRGMYIDPSEFVNYYKEMRPMSPSVTPQTNSASSSSPSIQIVEENSPVAVSSPPPVLIAKENTGTSFCLHLKCFIELATLLGGAILIVLSISSGSFPLAATGLSLMGLSWFMHRCGQSNSEANKPPSHIPSSMSMVHS